MQSWGFTATKQTCLSVCLFVLLRLEDTARKLEVQEPGLPRRTDTESAQLLDLGLPGF